MSQPAPGFIKHPDYEVNIEPSQGHVRILVGTNVVADTHNALAVTESRHNPVWYLPMADVHRSLLRPSETSTYCPFKGHASYWSIITPDQELPDSVWGYEQPFAECEPLLEHVAFYTDRVTLEIDGVVQADKGPGWSQ